MNYTRLLTQKQNFSLVSGQSSKIAEGHSKKLLFQIRYIPLFFATFHIGFQAMVQHEKPQFCIYILNSNDSVGLQYNIVIRLTLQLQSNIIYIKTLYQNLINRSLELSHSNLLSFQFLCMHVIANFILPSPNQSDLCISTDPYNSKET